MEFPMSGGVTAAQMGMLIAGVPADNVRKKDAGLLIQKIMI
jgi:hypothetical protein